MSQAGFANEASALQVRQSALCLLTLAAFLGSLGWPAVVRAATDDLVMLTASPLEREEARGSRSPIAIAVANTGTAPADVNLVVVSSSGPAGATPLGLAAAPASDGTVATSPGPIAVGGLWRVELGVDSQAPAGTYAARLIALSSTGGLATLDVAIVLRAALPDRAPAGALPTGTFDLERSVWAWFDGGRVAGGGRLPIQAEGRAISEVAPFVNGGGESLRLNVDNGALVVEAAPAAGSFVGKLRVIGDSADPAEVTIRLRDAIIWPALFVLAGVLGAVFADLGFSKLIPRLILRARIAELIERSRRAEDDGIGNDRSPDWPGRGAEPVRLFDPGPPPTGLLAHERDAALRDFELGDPDLRESRWGVHGSEFQKLATVVERHESFALGATAAADAWMRSRAALGSYGADLDTSPLAARVADAFRGRLVLSRPEFESLAAARERLLAELGEIATTARALAWMAGKAAGRQPWVREVGALQRRLANLPTGSAAEKDQVVGDLRTLHARMTASDVTEAGLAAEPRDDELELFLLNEGYGDTGGHPELVPLEPTSAELAAAASRANTFFVVVTAMFVVITGLTIQYFPNQGFGSIGDYATAFVWGLTATGVSQLARRALRTFKANTPPVFEDG